MSARGAGEGKASSSAKAKTNTNTSSSIFPKASSSKEKKEKSMVEIRERVLGFISEGTSSESDAPTLHDILRHFHKAKGSDLLAAVETLAEEFAIYQDRSGGYKLL